MTGNPTDQFRAMRGKTPEEAKFFWTGGPVELAERTWFQSQFGGCVAFETDDGIVLIDTGQRILAPDLAARLRQRSDAPIHTVIYTHGHVDHAYGLGEFLAEGQAPPRVIAHRAMADRFARYERTSGHNAALNARQFGGAVERSGDAGYRTFALRPEILPDTYYDDQMTIEVGGVVFELHHCRGETDDHTWVYCPQRQVLCPGDLLIWGVPNAGNPQKVQRYPWDWADGLRAMAGCRPRSMGPGHGGPVVDDPERLQQMLLETAHFLDSIVEQTLAVMEDGAPPHVDVVRRVEIPRSDSPWLQPIYDEGEFIVRNIIRHFGGWYSGRPSELKPAPRAAVAAEIAALAGGAVPLVERARVLADAGDLALASHLLDYALEAEPGNPEVQQKVEEIYESRAEAESSLMATNLFRSAAAYARAGRPYC